MVKTRDVTLSHKLFFFFFLTKKGHELTHLNSNSDSNFRFLLILQIKRIFLSKSGFILSTTHRAVSAARTKMELKKEPEHSLVSEGDFNPGSARFSQIQP